MNNFSTLATSLSIIDGQILKAVAGSMDPAGRSYLRQLQIENRLGQVLRGLHARIGQAVINVASVSSINGSAANVISDILAALQAEYKRSVSMYSVALTIAATEAYKLGKSEIFSKMRRLVPIRKDEDGPSIAGFSFSQADEAAIEAFKKQPMAWIGSTYSDDNSALTARLSELVRETIGKQGLGRREAAEQLHAALKAEFGLGTIGGITLPRQYSNKPLSYLSGLSASIATEARVTGSIRGMLEIGVTKYEVANPQDKRTCSVCSYMDGRVFEVRVAHEQIENLHSLGSPESIQAAKPWSSIKTIHERAKVGPETDKNDAAANKRLQQEGYGFPPYHLSCRCTVDVSEYDIEEARSIFAPAPQEKPKDPRLNSVVSRLSPEYQGSYLEYLERYLAAETAEKALEMLARDLALSKSMAELGEKWTWSSSSKEAYVVQDMVANSRLSPEKNLKEVEEKASRFINDGVIDLSVERGRTLTYDPVKKILMEDGKILDHNMIIVKQYAYAQAQLKRDGMDNVVLYRGVKGDYADQLKKIPLGETINAKPLNSTSESGFSASRFAGHNGVVLKEVTPSEHIIALPGKNDGGAFLRGVPTEGEYITIGRPSTVTSKGEEDIEIVVRAPGMAPLKMPGGQAYVVNVEGK